MKMNRFVYCLLMLLPLLCYADDMSVESFRRLDNDMDARINYPEKDPSGRTCAIIKVVNPNTGFVFDTGTVAVVKTKQGTGETWVYVQPGVKKFIVNHPTLGVMRDYYFPMAIEEATVYELRLATGTVHTYVEQKSTTAFLVVNSTPEGSDVYINGEWAGTTPFSKKYNQGESLQYRVSRHLYHDETGVVAIDKTKCEVNATLRPAYGSIKVTSQPSGASVWLDGEGQSRGKTPLTLTEVASGERNVRVQMPRYGQKAMNVTVADGATANVHAELSPSFATVTVTSLPGATIKADGAVKGTGTASWEQDAGPCDIEASLKGHRSQSRQIEVAAGVPQTLTIEPVPMYGTLVVESEPIGADIYIDGIKCGVAPDVIEHVLATEHAVRLAKDGCADFTASVSIAEGQEKTIRGSLPTGETVTITAGVLGADVYIDGKLAGKSPLTTIATYGSHTVFAMNAAGKRTEEKTFAVVSGSPLMVFLTFDGPVEYTVNGVTFRMMPVKGGTFTMGATGKLAQEAWDDEKPAHQVTLSDYMIGETEVTQKLWQAVMGDNPSNWKGQYLPVESVSWNDCKAFIKKLNQLTGLNFRLPTESEWEYAAKGGNKAHGFLYSGSDNIGEVAWYKDNSQDRTHPVATKVPNELGIYDMTGNVWEWCEDWKGDYPSQSQTNPKGPVSGSNRVFRGGSWDSTPRFCRVSFRNCSGPDDGGGSLGLRLALIL